MKIDFSQQLIDFRTGEPLMWKGQTADAVEKPMTLGFCASEGLLFPNQNGKPTENLLKHYELAMRVFEGGEQEITPEEASKIKDSIAAAYTSPLITGQCAKILNG